MSVIFKINQSVTDRQTDGIFTVTLSHMCAEINNLIAVFLCFNSQYNNYLYHDVQTVQSDYSIHGEYKYISYLLGGEQVNCPIKISFCAFPRAVVQVGCILCIQSVRGLHYPQAFGPRLCKSHTNLHVVV